MYRLTLVSDNPSMSVSCYREALVRKPVILMYCVRPEISQPSSSISSGICNQVKLHSKDLAYTKFHRPLSNRGTSPISTSLLILVKAVEANWSESWNGCNDVGHNG